MKRNIHFALRFDKEWSPSSFLTVNTIKTHQDVINKHGSTWWGKFGSGISDKKYNLIRDQVINQNTKTIAFLFENSPFDGAYFSEITDILDRYPKNEGNLIPSYYRIEAKAYNLFFKFNKFIKVQRKSLLNSLVLFNNPIIGSLESGFRGASSLFYVSMLEDFEKELFHE